MPSCSITSNLRSARRRFASHRLRADGVEVPERLVQVDRQPQVGAPGAHLGRPTTATTTKSGSKISTPSKPAPAAAASLSSRVPGDADRGEGGAQPVGGRQSPVA